MFRRVLVGICTYGALLVVSSLVSMDRRFIDAFHAFLDITRPLRM